MPDIQPPKTFQSISSPKTNSLGFKSPLPQGTTQTNDPLKTIPEGVSAKEAKDIQVKAVTKTETTFTKPASRALPQQQKTHYDSHALAHANDPSYWAGIGTIIAIPILLLLALFDIVVKAAPWPSGQ